MKLNKFYNHKLTIKNKYGLIIFILFVLYLYFSNYRFNKIHVIIISMLSYNPVLSKLFIVLLMILFLLYFEHSS